MYAYRRTVAAALMTASLSIVAPARGAITAASDPILYWNDVAVTNVVTNAPAQTRIFAMAKHCHARRGQCSDRWP